MSILTGDILFYLREEGFGDISVQDHDLEKDEGLETACFLLLFTDKRADDGDKLPGNQTDKRGWWADNYLGSKLWLLERETARKELIARAIQYAKESLQWFVDNGIVDVVDVTVELSKEKTAEIVLMPVLKKNGNSISYRYFYNWQKQIARRE